ncbi:polysaccharide biosynthesis protein [Calothrix sp. NIES-2100]|uniref:oligosaccharide flippase family protein n=1 Tax=Calothrix sp. NIES-2100 TaxID=1954172 RepID=UPI000B5F8CFB|nr:polysaccharide biosynthesis protein [Calothrix sp. NIES-2100]
MTNLSVSQRSGSIQLAELAKDTIVALIIQVTGLVLIYLLQIFLAQWMGRTEYGIYEYVMSWSLLLAVPAELGLPTTVLRLLPEYRVKQEWGRLQGLVRGCWLLVFSNSLLLIICATGTILVINYYHSFVYATPLLLGMGLVLLQSLARFQQETGRAMEDILVAFIPSQIIWPVLVLAGGFVFMQTQDDLTSIPMIAIASGMFIVIVVVQLYLLWKKLHSNFEAATPVYAYREWLNIAVILLIQQASFGILSQTDTVMIGSFIGPEAAGIYNAAVKTAAWTSFVLQIVNMVAAPVFTTLYTKGDIPELQKVVSCVTNWIFWPTVAMTLLLMTFTQPILNLFGAGFVEASLSLKILIMGQMVNALCGSVGILMIMTGHQNKSLPVIVASALLNIVLNAILIPIFNITGAAIATSFTMIVWNIWLGALVVKYVGVRPSVFYTLFARENESIT